MKVVGKGHFDPPPGLREHRFVDADEYREIPILLPVAIVEELKEAKRRALEEEKTKEEAERDSWKKPSTPDFDPVKEEKELAVIVDDHDENELEDYRAVAVYDRMEPFKLIKDIKTRTVDKDHQKRNEALYKKVKSMSRYRLIATPKADLGDFKRLRRCHPHFSDVIDLVQDQFHFWERTGKPFVIPPILLGGPPGVGKTRFSQDLAAAIGTMIHRMPFDNLNSGASLLGSDKNWANSTHGVVFELVVLGHVANPVVLLDELDKASKRQEGYAASALHSLLEPETSSKVRDISLDFEFNASHVIWIATANEMDRIPASLRSRFREFWIEQPTGAQALQMAEVLAEEIHYLMDLPDFEKPPAQLVRFIAHLSAREQVQALKSAYVAAHVDGRRQISMADLPEQVRLDVADYDGGQTPPELLH